MIIATSNALRVMRRRVGLPRCRPGPGAAGGLRAAFLRAAHEQRGDLNPGVGRACLSAARGLRRPHASRALAVDQPDLAG